ncbi:MULTISPECIES: hypothetical protein [Streptomyces]|uniref:Uncharacterized protein n=1 Tax=Streptomyces kasugaensis TaxID=1946 RepID=A0A4Q9HJA0_STRKA|nr:hypothetical protein [Streptomyces kasugaensis]TBO54724.1 hypothetical protein EYS09_37025 [Streptomyces kasugaensis]
MSSATISSATAHPSSLHPSSLHPAKGAAAFGTDPVAGAAPADRHALGNAFRAVGVFAAAAFGVLVMGEYADD